MFNKAKISCSTCKDFWVHISLAEESTLNGVIDLCNKKSCKHEGKLIQAKCGAIND